MWPLSYGSNKPAQSGGKRRYWRAAAARRRGATRQEHKWTNTCSVLGAGEGTTMGDDLRRSIARRTGKREAS
eukprot:4321029-Prymnesium_polylepis.1